MARQEDGALALATANAHVHGVDGEDCASVVLGETVGLDDRGVFHGPHARFARALRRQPQDRFSASSQRMRRCPAPAPDTGLGVLEYRLPALDTNLLH